MRTVLICTILLFFFALGYYIISKFVGAGLKASLRICRETLFTAVFIESSLFGEIRKLRSFYDFKFHQKY